MTDPKMTDRRSAIVVAGLKLMRLHSPSNVPAISMKTPPVVICMAAAPNTCPAVTCRRVYADPTAHPAHASCNAIDAEGEVPARAASGRDVRPHQRGDSGEPDEQSDPLPREELLPVAHQRVHAGHPERRHADEHRHESARQVLRAPGDAAVAHEQHQKAENRQGGPLPCRRKTVTTTHDARPPSIRPAAIYRRPPMRNGGMVSSAILIATYVVPQTMQIVPQAIQARRRRRSAALTQEPVASATRAPDGGGTS